jgi:hypothetical protein
MRQRVDDLRLPRAGNGISEITLELPPRVGQGDSERHANYASSLFGALISIRQKTRAENKSACHTRRLTTQSGHIGNCGILQGESLPADLGTPVLATTLVPEPDSKQFDGSFLANC